jgi:hypothetical protein
MKARTATWGRYRKKKSAATTPNERTMPFKKTGRTGLIKLGWVKR